MSVRTSCGETLFASITRKLGYGFPFGDMQSGFVVAERWELMLIVFVRRVRFTNAFVEGNAFGRAKPKQ